MSIGGGFCYTEPMNQKTWRIGIDCRLAGKKHAGIGRYIENLIIRLPQLSSTQSHQVEWVFFFSDKAQAEEFEIPENVTSIFVPYRHYSVAEQVFVPRIFARQHLDLLHIPHFNIPLLYKGKIMVTIHDLLWHEYKGNQVTTLPKWQYFMKYKAYLYTTDQAIKRASWILVPAETVKKTVLKYFPFAKSKIEVTTEGIAEPYREALLHDNEVSKAQRKKQLVYVGSLYPHKNVMIAVKALQELPHFTLIIVGTRNVFQEQMKKEIKKLGLEDRVEFKGYLTDEELITLFRESFALVQPSLSEGFGLTGIEAMAAGLPVVASQIPIFQEVYQDAAMYFDPFSSSSFAQAVQNIEFDSWSKITEKGKKVANHYDWDKTAELTFQSYIRLLK